MFVYFLLVASLRLSSLTNATSVKRSADIPSPCHTGCPVLSVMMINTMTPLVAR